MPPFTEREKKSVLFIIEKLGNDRKKSINYLINYFFCVSFIVIQEAFNEI